MIIYKTWNHWLFRFISAMVGLVDYIVWIITLGWVLLDLESGLYHWYVNRKENK
jgi:hypothetical protein